MASATGSLDTREKLLQAAQQKLRQERRVFEEEKKAFEVQKSAARESVKELRDQLDTQGNEFLESFNLPELLKLLRDHGGRSNESSLE